MHAGCTGSGFLCCRCIILEKAIPGKRLPKSKRAAGSYDRTALLG
jgi:hypothetical protein